MAVIEKRKTKAGKIHYRVRVRIKGFPLETASFPTRKEADRWAVKTEADMREGRYFGTSTTRRHTLANLIDEYSKVVMPRKKQSNRHTQKAQLEWWKTELGQLRLAEVTPAVIIECRDRLLAGKTKQGKTRSSATVVRYLAVLSHAFSWAMREKHWVRENPLRRVTKPTEPRGRTRFLSPEERKRLLLECQKSKNASLYPVVILALSTGMRKGEIMGLVWDQIDFKQKRILLSDTKSGEPRGVPLTGLAFDVLRDLSKFRRIDTPLVFPGPQQQGRPAVSVDIGTAWDLAVARAKLENFKFHDLRHSAASELASMGASLIEIGAILGHKSVLSTKRYAHLTEGHSRELLERMNARVFNEEADDGKNTA